MPLAYWVLRNALKSTEVDTLVRLRDVSVSSFVDSFLAPETDYEYRVAVVNTDGYEAASNAISVSGYTIGAVALLSVGANSKEGTIALRWSRFRDPGFTSYEVLRRLVGTNGDGSRPASGKWRAKQEGEKVLSGATHRRVTMERRSFAKSLTDGLTIALAMALTGAAVAHQGLGRLRLQQKSYPIRPAAHHGSTDICVQKSNPRTQ